MGNLGRMRWRTVLTAMGVVIGTAALVLLVSLGVGLQRLALQDIAKQFGAATIITVYPFGQAMGPMSGPPGQSGEVPKKQAKLDDKAVKKFKKLEHAQAVFATREIPVSRLRFGRLEGPPFSMIGIDKEAVKVLDLKVAQGHIAFGGKKVILGAQVPKQFFDQEGAGPQRSEQAGKLDLLNERLDITVGGGGGEGGPSMSGPGGETAVSGGGSPAKTRRYRAKVAAILKAGGFENDFRIFVPSRQAEKLAKVLPREQREQYSWVKIKIDSPNAVTNAQKEVESMGYSVVSLNDMLKGLNTFFVVIQAVLGGIASIALLVAAFGIANTMTMAIYERTKEIGVMKAIGAAGGDIMRIFLMEAATIGFVGGLAGILFGFLLGKAINAGLYLYFADQMKDIAGGVITTPIWLMLFTLIFATGIGLLSGVFPAARASKLSPLGALRHE